LEFDLLGWLQHYQRFGILVPQDQAENLTHVEVTRLFNETAQVSLEDGDVHTIKLSSMATYTGSAKIFTLAELEKATDRFNSQNILGEGGFGRVYHGVLEDGTELAVKVLRRDDQQRGREFMAEVEMLSRLHHRNLVKLIGICTEELCEQRKAAKILDQSKGYPGSRSLCKAYGMEADRKKPRKHHKQKTYKKGSKKRMKYEQRSFSPIRAFRPRGSEARGKHYYPPQYVPGEKKRRSDHRSPEQKHFQHDGYRQNFRPHPRAPRTYAYEEPKKEEFINMRPCVNCKRRHYGLCPHLRTPHTYVKKEQSNAIVSPCSCKKQQAVQVIHEQESIPDSDLLSQYYENGPSVFMMRQEEEAHNPAGEEGVNIRDMAQSISLMKDGLQKEAMITALTTILSGRKAPVKQETEDQKHLSRKLIGAGKSYGFDLPSVERNCGFLKRTQAAQPIHTVPSVLSYVKDLEQKYEEKFRSLEHRLEIV